MSEKDMTTQQASDEGVQASAPPVDEDTHDFRTVGNDDRRGTVRPTDNPAPRSPAADEDAVREGREKLDRVKPY